MTVELIGIIITGALTGMDFIVNIATLCFTGRCRSDCCGMHFEHASSNSELPSKRYSERKSNRKSDVDSDEMDDVDI